MNESSSRRAFITQCLRSGAVLLSIGMVTAACVKDKPATKQLTNSCNDFSNVGEAELEKRKKLAYVEQAPDPLKQCSNCKLYLPPKRGEQCGACLLFQGPVDSKGSCTYWAPLEWLNWQRSCLQFLFFCRRPTWHMHVVVCTYSISWKKLTIISAKIASAFLRRYKLGLSDDDTCSWSPGCHFCSVNKQKKPENWFRLKSCFRLLRPLSFWIAFQAAPVLFQREMKDLCSGECW